MKTFSKKSLLSDIKDYVMITLGTATYAFGWCAFLLPYQIGTGGVTGLSAIVYYATGIPMQNVYMVINAIFLMVALKILGWKFMLKTIYGIAFIYFFLWLFQLLMQGDDGKLIQLMGENQDFMACILGSVMCGLGLAIVFLSNGSTGGTDIIAAVVNKYRDVTMGKMIMYCDIVIISSCYFVFNDWRRVVFGFCTLFVISIVLDYYMNSMRQSVQFLIVTKKYDDIAHAITHEVGRGCTLLHGEGFYSKEGTKVIMVIARKNESSQIFRIVKHIDENAFVSQSSVIGVFGEGFDVIKAK